MTGTFDNWSKSNKLEKQTFGGYEKTVEIPETKEKILYKVRAPCVQSPSLTRCALQTKLARHLLTYALVRCER